MQQDLADIKSEAGRLKMKGRFVDALRLRLQLEELYERHAIGAVEQSLNLNWIASLAVRTGNLDEAERAARKCLEIYRPVATDRDNRLATYLCMLSAVLAERREFDEAVTRGEEAVVLFAQIHGENSSFVQYRRVDIDRMRRKDTRPYLDE
jgi:tetratricopeptide (TPR) repeat protein